MMCRQSLYAVSTSVGSGKTRAAIEYLASPEVSTQNFIYVAPTIRLINQTADNLRRRLGATPGSTARNLHLIHSESRYNDDLPTSAETLAVINDAIGNVGKIVIVTTKTFLAILPEIANKHQWRVIMDEAFAPVEFLNFYLGNKVMEGWSYFKEAFTVDRHDNYRILPAEGKAGWVKEIATGNIKRSGQRYKGLQPFAAAVANPAVRCELVLTTKAKAILETGDGEHQSHPSLAVDNQAESVLLIASYVTPEHFQGFDEAIFMSALFEHTMLYHLWTRVFGICFKGHPRFSKVHLRDIHLEQGKYVAIGHLLHQEDSSSKRNLSRNVFTVALDEREPGQRVVDRLVGIASQYFQGTHYLLQVNNGYDYEDGSSLLPSNGLKIPTLSHGLNEFQDCNHVAALAITNPIPQEADWIKARTGLDSTEALMAYRIHTTYQAVGRSSIRKAKPSSDRKVFLTAGYLDAWMLHQLFEGSKWLGQVGDMPSLRQLSAEGREGGLIMETATRILDYLASLPAVTYCISSRALKAKLAPDCKGRTWSAAAVLAGQSCWEWTKAAQSFIRREQCDPSCGELALAA